MQFIPISAFLLLTNFTATKSAMLPLVFAALLLDSAIVAIWYMLGSVLGNDRAKSAARNEAYQLVGTAILLMVVIGVMLIFGSAFYNLLGSTRLMNPSAISTMCHNIMSTTSLGVIGPTGSLLSNPTTPSTQFEGICGVVDSASSSPDITEQIDYPLAAVGTLMANLTNQTAANLDYSFSFDAFLGFLSGISPSASVCVGALFTQCFVAVPEAPPPAFRLSVYFSPYAGYELLLNNLATLGVLLTTAIEALVAQLNFIVIAMYIWPYLLFIGIVLRATMFTRPLGGLFIAVAVVTVLIFPAVYTIEYLSLAGQVSSSAGAAYGFNPVTALPGKDIAICPGQGPAMCGGVQASCTGSIPYAPVCPSGATPTCTSSGSTRVTPTCNYTINFFIMPNVKNIMKVNSCWQDNILVAEGADIGFLLIPFGSLVSLLINNPIANPPNIFLPARCDPKDAIKVFYQLIDVYGIMGIGIYVIPLLNLIISLTAVLGISGLLGGDTELAGLAKLVP